MKSHMSIIRQMGAVFVCLVVLVVFEQPVRAEQRTSAGRPAVYVQDFEIDTADVHTEPGLIPHPTGRPGPGGRLRSRPGGPEDPAVRARKIVDLMSTHLVEDLAKLGFDARRLAPGAPLPEAGWLVRGVFVEVDEGNRLRRAVVGFGSGQADFQAVVTLSDLSRGIPEPFYELNTGGETRKLPGAVITLNPYAAAARFVLAGRDLDRSVVQTAENIASSVARNIA